MINYKLVSLPQGAGNPVVSRVQRKGGNLAQTIPLWGMGVNRRPTGSEKKWTLIDYWLSFMSNVNVLIEGLAFIRAPV